MAKINASLVQLAKVYRSGSLPPVSRVVVEQLHRAFDLAQNSQNALERSLELKSRENLELKQELNEQHQKYEVELKCRDDRIAELSRQLNEKNFTESTREVNVQGRQLLECDNITFRETTSIVNSLDDINFYLMDENSSISSLAVSEGLVSENSQQETKLEVVNCQDDIPTQYPPIKVYPIGAAPNNNRPKATRTVSNRQRVYVGNLDLNVDAGLLEAIFSKFGKITDIKINYKADYAIAFLTFQTIEMAENAKASSYVMIGRRQCKVSDFRSSSFNVKVEGFSKDTTEVVLKTKFENFGEVVKVQLKGQTKATIGYKEESSARAAVKAMKGFRLAGNKKLKVHLIS